MIVRISRSTPRIKKYCILNKRLYQQKAKQQRSVLDQIKPEINAMISKIHPDRFGHCDKMRHINQEAMKQINILRQQAKSHSDDTNKNELMQVIRVYAANGDYTPNLHVITRNPASQEDAQSFLVRICEVVNGNTIFVNSHADSNEKQPQSGSDELQNKVDIAELIRQQMAVDDVDAFAGGTSCYDQQDLASMERIRRFSQMVKFDPSIPLNERVLFAMKVEDFIQQYEDIFGQIASGMDLADYLTGLKVVDSLSLQSMDDQGEDDDALENVVDIDLTFNQFVNMIHLMQDNDDDDDDDDDE
ncbi:hypothetical protein MIR68_010110 [Amoeboaphelidium protococcarum]|nr:hypothetical protein MIR68_010110 [Amoeboaphelidium protococcarum]